MEALFFSACGGTVLNLGRQSEVEESAKEKAEWVGLPQGGYSLLAPDLPLYTGRCTGVGPGDECPEDRLFRASAPRLPE